MGFVFDFQDQRTFRRFGNLTASSTSEVLVAARAYVEQSSQAQRSIQSTSATDNDGSGTGAREVRITYLDSNYVQHVEDVLTNGTAKVNTVGTDIRFIERFEVIKGTAAVGAIQLMTGITGGATEFCGIAAGTNEAFLCHHYVPAGKICRVLNWGATIDDDSSFKLLGQALFGANRVDQVLDLVKLAGTVAVGSDFKDTVREPFLTLGEKTYLRVTVVPAQATSTVIRAFMHLWEDNQ